MGFSPETNLTDRFEKTCEAVGSERPRWRLGNTYDGFSEALLKWSAELVPAVLKRIRRQTLAIAGRFEKRFSWKVIAIDGTRLECPRTQANEQQLGCAGKEKTAALPRWVGNPLSQ